MTANLERDEVNGLIQAVEQRLQSLTLARDELDEFKDPDDYRALEAQIRDLQDQQRLLNRRWNELTAGFSDNL